MANKLTAKIYRNMVWMSIFLILISTCISMIIIYQNVENQIEAGNKADAEYISFYIEKYGTEGIDKMEMPEGRRVTVIDSDGFVLSDTMAHASSMENHKERAEVRDALEYGTGKSKRLSDTLSETSYYYALRMSDGNILRVSTTSNTVYETFTSVIPLFLIMMGIILVFAFVMSRYLTKKIVKPINYINAAEPEKIEIYEELAPFVSKIRSQNQVIRNQLKDLRRKKIEFETITENMNEGLIVIGKNGHVISYNNSAIKLLDVKASHGELNNALMFNRNSKFENVVNSSLDGTRAECKLTVNERVCEIMATPVMDDDALKGAVILIIDITEKEKRESLRREFSANVSHELKTPLTSISGYAEIMKTGIVKDEDMKNFAQIIYTEATRLIELIGDIIKVSKLDEEDVQIDSADIDLKEMVYNIAARLKERADKKNVTVETETTESLSSGANEKLQKWPFVINSYSQIVDEIIYNIVENAIKYNKDNGNVRVSLKANDGIVTLKVKDTGIGIPKDDIGRVFERFYRVDKSHSKSVGGTGLGLSIVKHGAAFIGAEIKMESEEGRGTEVIVVFRREK